MRHNQKGMTFLGAAIIGIFVVGTAVLLLKLVPPYLEYWSVQKIVAEMAKEPGFASMSPAELRRSFDRHADVNGVNVIKGSDLEISKGPNGNLLVAHYTVTVPLVANLSALIEFNTGGGDASTGAAGDKKLVL